MANKLKTLYELFSSVSKEQIDNAINQLTPKERQVLFERYGNDLENPKEAIEWTKEKQNYYYGNVYTKLKRILKIEPKKKRSQEVASTIYEILKEYTKKQIDDAFFCLDMEDKAIIQKRYGEDFNIPTISKKMTPFEKQRFKEAVKKLETLLVNPRNFTISKVFSVPLNGYTEEEIKKMTEQLTSEEQLFLMDPQNEIFKTMNSRQRHSYIQDLTYTMLVILKKNRKSLPEVQTPVVERKKSENLPVEHEETDEENYHKQMLQRYLNNPTFLNELKSLSCEKITIVSLKYGLASKRIFSVEEISETLDLPVEYIIEVLREFLNNYKNKVTQAIDRAIDIVIHENGVPQKRR